MLIDEKVNMIKFLLEAHMSNKGNMNFKVEVDKLRSSDFWLFTIYDDQKPHNFHLSRQTLAHYTVDEIANNLIVNFNRAVEADSVN
jgi:quinol monooxygenase YgiN